MIAYIVTAAISVSAGVLGMGMWCGRKHIAALSERDRARIDYATERRKRIEAEHALTDMEAQKDRIHDLLTAVSSESNAYLVRLEQIAAIPNNSKKPNGGLAKAQRIAGNA